MSTTFRLAKNHPTLVRLTKILPVIETFSKITLVIFILSVRKNKRWVFKSCRH